MNDDATGDALRAEVDLEVLRHRVQKLMFCPVCRDALRVESSVLIEVEGLGWCVVCGACFDRRDERHLARLGKVGITDGRLLRATDRARDSGDSR